MARTGRPRSFDRDAALAAAMTLFWRKGFTATSIAELCSAIGISAPSLYAAFRSKEALFAEALGRYDTLLGPILWGPFSAAPTARAAVGALLLGSAAALTDAKHPPGCMVTLSAVREEGNAELGQRVAAARAEGFRLLLQRLERAVAEGELPDGLDLAAIARFYQCVQQGMSIQARDGASRAELETTAQAALAAWDGLTEASKQ